MINFFLNMTLTLELAAAENDSYRLFGVLLLALSKPKSIISENTEKSDN